MKPVRTMLKAVFLGLGAFLVWFLLPNLLALTAVLIFPEKQAAILKAEAEKQAAILKADGEAQAIMAVQKAMADSLALLNEKAPNDQVLKLKALEAMQKVADGKATKIIIPSELQGFAGLASGIAETVKETK